jgi:hypothetical protein
LSVERVIEQDLIAIKAGFVPSQSILSCLKAVSFCLINILYAVMGEPFVTGSFQDMETLSLTLAVVIVVGESGTNAHSNVNTSELTE